MKPVDKDELVNGSPSKLYCIELLICFITFPNGYQTSAARIKNTVSQLLAHFFIKKSDFKTKSY